jgi:hypothetical protein
MNFGFCFGGKTKVLLHREQSIDEKIRKSGRSGNQGIRMSQKL